MEYDFTVNQVNMLITSCESAISNIDTAAARLSWFRNPLASADLAKRRADWVAIKAKLLMTAPRHNTQQRA